MREAALLFALLTSAYLGFALLALSQPRNWAIAMRPKPFNATYVPVLRVIGSLLLALSLALALWRDGPAFGAILWAVMLAVASMFVVATLSWQNMRSGR
jgi:hypothetical protein